MSCNDGYIYSAPVGSFKSNGFGIFDMMGNVSEWVEDCGHDTYDGAPIDGSAWVTNDCSSRVIRGGSWNDVGSWFTRREAKDQYYRSKETGFRIARDLP